MLILTTEQMSFIPWLLMHSDCATLQECMAVYAMLESEGGAQ